MFSYCLVFTVSHAADQAAVGTEDARRLVPTVSDVKPSADGRTALFCSATDGFGEIDLCRNSMSWRVPFGEPCLSIERLPADGGGAYALSTAGGRLVAVSAGGVELSSVPLPGVCGLCWDGRRSCLWAVAATNLLRYSVSGGVLRETGRWDYRVAWQDPHGNDLVPDGGDGLYLTTNEAILHFDPDTEAFDLVRLERNVRAYSASRSRGDILSRAGDGIRRWRVADPYEPSSPADNRMEEVVRSGRREDAYPPLVDFESPESADWVVDAEGADAKFSRACDRRMFGRWTGRLVYRGRAGGRSRIRFRPSRPVPLPENGFDCFTVWIHGTRFGRGANTDPCTPRPGLRLNILLADGGERTYSIAAPDWKGWFPVYLRFPEKDLAELHGRGVCFDGFTLEGQMQPDDRVFHFDNIAFFREKFDAIDVKPRARRNLTPLKGANLGNNTGEGVLPFPVREETILPPSPADGRECSSSAPEYALAEVLGPCPERLETNARRVGKTLIVDFYAPAGAVTGLVVAAAGEGTRTRSFAVPFMAYGPSRSQKLLVDLLDGRYFRLAQFDWYRSNASLHFWRDMPGGRGCAVAYSPKTDGTYNDLSERLFVSLSDTLDDVMPTVPNPASPWRGEVGSRVWRSHGAFFRDEDRRLWQAVYDHGMRRMTVVDHETCWRDGGDSYTYRTNAAPAKGGDAAMRDYSDFMRRKLGFRYGPYNNYVEIAPVNGNWSWDMVVRRPDRSPVGAWVRTFATKASTAPAWSESVAAALHEIYGFDTAYCDVHTTLYPWSRVDFDARVPGAGTVGGVFYGWGEVLLSQKRAWNGPVFSEGGSQCMYAGLSDGNYAYDPTYDFEKEPWLLDFELKRIHPLEIEVGMGLLRHFAPSADDLLRRYHRPAARTAEEAEPLLDRYICAELAFGHAGYLVIDWLWTPAKTYGPAYGEQCTLRLEDNPQGWRIAARSYFMTQAIAARYSVANVSEIRYCASDGRWLTASDAIRAGELGRNQVAVLYDDGTRVVVNASPCDRLRCELGGARLDLPPFGYRAWTADSSVIVESADRDGCRYDYCRSPDYVYLDGRGNFVELPGASGDGAFVTLLKGGAAVGRVHFSKTTKGRKE